MNMNGLLIFLLILHFTADSGRAEPQSGIRHNDINGQNFALKRMKKQTSGAVPTCAKPCLNGGICSLENKCACKPGFTGDQCEKKWDFCLESPISPLHSMVFLNKTHGKVMCIKGYEIDENRDEYDIECVGNIWFYDGKPPELAPQCVPTCSPKCQNGGTCFARNKCVCMRGFIGNYCEKLFCSETEPNMTQVLDNLSVDVLCPRGYTLNKKKIKVEVVCQNTDWVIKYSQKQCEPICTIPCQNNGKCVGPGKCFCHKEFFGAHCEQKECIDNPQNIRFVTSLRKSPSLVTMSCADGYQFISGNTSTEGRCQNGIWTYSYYGPQCFPICSQPCVNGGRCVAPDICNCPEGFTGKFCEKRYSLTIGGKKCIFPFHYKGQIYVSCTRADRTYPWCATEVNQDGSVIYGEMCYADLGWSKFMETKGGVACSSPFQSSGMKYFSCVKEPGSSSEDTWCLPDSSSVYFTNSYNQSAPVSKQYCLAESESKSIEEVILLSNGETCKDSDYARCLGDQEGAASFCGEKYDESQGNNFCLQDYGWKKLEITKSSKKCVFPFVIEGGMKVNNCVSLKGEAAWCATLVNQKGLPLEKNECISSQWRFGSYPYDTSGHSLMFYASGGASAANRFGSASIVESAGGRRCVFPFSHGGSLHFQCVGGKSEVPWCATKVSGTKVVQSDFCLPDMDSYYQELVNLQYGMRGFKNEEYLKSALKRIDGVNENLLVYPKVLGYQRSLAMLMGERIFNKPPHLGPTFKYFDTDEHFTKLVKEQNFPSEMELKEKGIGGMLELSGRSCCSSNPNLQIKVDYYREKLENQVDNFLTKRNLSVPSGLMESYAFVLRDWLESNDSGPANTLKLSSESRPYNLSAEREGDGEYKTFTATIESTTLSYEATNQEGNTSLKESLRGRSFGDYLLPTSVFGELCKPFLLNGRWYGYGSCIKQDNGDYNCAVVTNQKGEAKRFSECQIKEENSGFWIPHVQNPSTYSERNIMVTKQGELCFFPFKFSYFNMEENWYDSCVESELCPYGQCPTSVNEDWTATLMQDCDPFAGTPQTLTTTSLNTPSPTSLEIFTLLENESKVETLTPSPASTIHVNSSEAIHVLSSSEESAQISIISAEAVQLASPAPEDPLRKNIKPSDDEYFPYSSTSREPKAPTSPSDHEVFKQIIKPSGDILAPSSNLTSEPPLSKMVKTVKNNFCILPFIYKGKIHYKCTTEDNDLPWCPTEMFADGRLKSAEICQTEEVSNYVEENFTVERRKCIFPFLYKGIMYKNCTKADGDGPWCPTMVTQEKTPLFGGYCQDESDASFLVKSQDETDVSSLLKSQGGLLLESSLEQFHESEDCEKDEVDQKHSFTPTHSIVFTLDGFLCQFPFEYEGKFYHHCIQSEHIRPWCKINKGLGNEVDTTGECRLGENVLEKAEDIAHKDVFTVRGQKCIFPFWYNANMYVECTTDEARDGPWCATEVDHNGYVMARETCSIEFPGKTTVVQESVVQNEPSCSTQTSGSARKKCRENKVSVIVKPYDRNWRKFIEEATKFGKHIYL